MKRQEMMRKFESFVKAAPGTITEEMQIEEIRGWDSLSNVEFRWLVEEEFGHDLDGVKVEQAQKVGDLMDLIAELGLFED